MPELPEVESVRRSLEGWLANTRITRVRVLRRDVVTLPSDPAGGYGRNPARRDDARRPVRAADLLAGATMTDLVRHGKQLCLGATNPDGRWRGVLVHLGMTGALERMDHGVTPPAHTHVVWTLEDGRRLAFSDPRRFGGLWVVGSRQELSGRFWSALGPDALGIRTAHLGAALARTRRPVKSALLDQGVLAGVGNIYADEALFRARVHPTRPGDSLDRAEMARLAGAIRRVLREAVEAGGSTLRDFRDAEGRPGRYAGRHRVYGRSGQACLTCGTLLETLVVAQRTTVCCPRCQGVSRGAKGR